MTTLSQDQLYVLEDILTTKYSIKTSDIKDEVIDHMACEIEHMMQKDNDLLFLNAVKITLLKWHKQLQPHIFVGYKNVPRFMGKKWVRTDLSILLLTHLLGMGSTYIITTFFAQPAYDTLFTSLYYTILLLALTLSVLGFFSFKKSHSLRARISSTYMLALIVVAMISGAMMLKIGYAPYLFFLAIYCFIPSLSYYIIAFKAAQHLPNEKIN